MARATSVAGCPRVLTRSVGERLFPVTLNVAFTRTTVMKTAGVLLAAVGAAGLIAATTPQPPVKGVSYRVRTQTQLPNFGGGGAGGGEDNAGRGFPGGGFGGGQLVRVDLAGNRAKVEFQLGAPPNSSLSDYFVMILDSNKVYRVSPDSQTYADAVLGGAGFGGRGNRGPGGGGDFAGRGGRGGRGAGAGGDNQGRGGRGGFVNPMQALQ